MVTAAAVADVVILCSFGISLFGLKLEEVGAIRLAEALGIGTADFESLKPLRIKL